MTRCIYIYQSFCCQALPTRHISATGHVAKALFKHMSEKSGGRRRRVRKTVTITNCGRMLLSFCGQKMSCHARDSVIADGLMKISFEISIG